MVGYSVRHERDGDVHGSGGSLRPVRGGDQEGGRRREGVDTVDVDLEAKVVTVRGERLDDERLRAAIDEAGYDVA